MLARQPEQNCLPAPITSAILRRVLCELPIGTSRAVESCINSYKKRFMSSQDILEFLKSIARQSETLKTVFREHERANGVESPPQEQPGSESPNGVGSSSVREPTGPPAGLSADNPTALLHGPIPAVTDATAWSVPDGASGVPLELLWQQEQEYANWMGQPLRHFTQHSAPRPSSRESRSSQPQRSPRETQRNPSPRALQRNPSPRTLPRSTSPPRRAMPEPGGSFESPRGRPPPAPTSQKARAPTPSNDQGPPSMSVPFELLWEQDQWNNCAPVPSPEDLISGRRINGTPQASHSRASGSNMQPPGGAAEDHHHDPLGVPFELLWEAEQYQKTSYQPPPPRPQSRTEPRHSAQASLPLDLLWQQDHDLVANAEEILSRGQAREPAPPLPLDLVWPTDEWQKTAYCPVEPAQETANLTPRKPVPVRSAPKSTPVNRNHHHSPGLHFMPAPEGVPFDLMFQQGPLRSADNALAPPTPQKPRRTTSHPDLSGIPGMALTRQLDPRWAAPAPPHMAGPGEPVGDEDIGSVSSDTEEPVAKEEVAEEAPAKPKRRRIRTVKPSAPPTEEEQEQMTRYASRRKDEIERRRKEAARAAARAATLAPAARAKGKKKGDKEPVQLQPMAAGTEDKPLGMLRFTIVELAKHLDLHGKAALRKSVSAYLDGHHQPQVLANDILELVDAHQLIIPLPLPHGRDPFRLGGMPMAAGKFGPSAMAGTHFLPPPFPGMPGFHPGMLPMGMHFPPGMDMGLLMPKPKPAGGRRRKRKRGADRDASAKCPVCVEHPLQDERWVKCDGCSTWYHQVCVLYNELANGRKLRFFCRTPQCQKRNSRQLNRRYRKARHPTSPMLPDTPLSTDLAARTVGVCRADRKVVVKEVYAAPAEECMAGAESPKDASGKCQCCTRRTVAGLQHTVTGSDLLFMLLFVDEHTPAPGQGPWRAVVQELAVSGMYEEASAGEGLRVEAALLAGYLADAGRRGIETVTVAPATEDATPLISSADAAECALRAREVWLRAAEHAHQEQAVAEFDGGGAKLRCSEMKEGRAAASVRDCQMMESAGKLRAFLASRQYGFTTLQMAKYASMMLVYHLDQAMTASAAAATEPANGEGEEEEEEMEDVGEAAEAVDGASDEEMEGGQHAFEGMGHGFHHHHHQHHHHAGEEGWRKEEGFRGQATETNMLYSQPYMFPFLDNEES